MSTIKDTWHLFSPAEKRNIAFYIAGIMLYKFGLEAFNGSITALATNRYDWDNDRFGGASKTFERVGLLQGLNQACQCVGSILIAPLIKRYPTRLVLSVAIIFFALLTAILMIVDAATGGRIKPKNWSATHAKDDFSYYGNYATDGMIPIYCFTGIAYGMVELIRRVIPRDIVGGNVQKLRRMDATVHIFYEITGTAGAFCTALALIPAFGNNFSFIITPICFVFAAGCWFMISDLNFTKATTPKPMVVQHEENGHGSRSNAGRIFTSLGNSILLFFKSYYTGAYLVCTSRKYIWLLPGYAMALYGHRYLENGIAPIVARRYLGNSAWSQIMVGGSNFGELCGAAFVFLFTNMIPTPMPWLRLDALMLLIVWYLPYWYPTPGRVSEAWKVAGTFIPISFGWAAGDVSLAAYIQASLARAEHGNSDVSALGAVMSFLYTTYICTYAIASPLLGKYVDSVYTATGGSSRGGTVRPALINIAGVQFTVLSVVVITSTFIPKGALSFNPKMLTDEHLDKDIADTESFVSSEMEDREMEKEKNSEEADELGDQVRNGSITVGLHTTVNM